MYKVSPERERSPFRAQTANDRPSRSPARVNTDYDRPRTPIESGTHSRDTSASRPNTGNYFFQPQTSPYVNGKKNENFLHPSFKSNNIFYDHNYGYKNDLPNDRLLTPVKNDKHRKNDDDNVSNRGDRTPPKSPLQRNHRDTSEDNLLRTQSYTARRLITEENPLRNNLNRSVDIALNKDKDSAVNTRKNSIISQNAPTPNRYGRYNRETMDTSPDIKAAGRPSGVNNNNNNKRDYDDISTGDDRSETSTVMSTLSSTGYLCPKCLNRHMVGAKNAACAVAREQEKDHENRITNMHMKYLEQQEAQKQLERTKRAQDTREAQKKLEEDYQARREQRRSPEKEKDTSFKKMFDRQEEMRQKQLMLKQVFGTHLKDQMNARDNEKEREKRANAQPYDTTLRMGGNDYYNKYLDDPAAVRSTLQNQIEEKTIRQNREKEAEKRSAQQKETQALKELQEEEQKRKMKEWIHKKELREAFARHAENKEQQQREAALSKSQERVAMDQGYNQYKKKQKEEEEKTRKQLFDFKQYLVKQQEKLSYKQQYEERKQQKEATSFDPTSKKIKKKYPCGECNDPYEKVHLTKMH